ncbi:hypothetical protein NPIL_310351 [Nephila pilipes]|uniref:Uncharacterized protein n=1 Tax=Nephila pilipes TaxID=299642 RepID=A0A8X6P2V0_NEPPI|nr:hypothetical protein NPIL_310351 [Nephila pilipes]
MKGDDSKVNGIYRHRERNTSRVYSKDNSNKEALVLREIQTTNILLLRTTSSQATLQETWTDKEEISRETKKRKKSRDKRGQERFSFYSRKGGKKDNY